MAKTLKIYNINGGDLLSIWIQNGSYKREILKTNDEAIVKSRWVDINEQIKRIGYAETAVLYYKKAKDHGCEIVMNEAMLRVKTHKTLLIKKINDEWSLVIKEGKEELVLYQESHAMVKHVYMRVMKDKETDPDILNKIWQQNVAS